MNAGVERMPNLRGGARMTTEWGVKCIACVAPAVRLSRVALGRRHAPFAQLRALILHPSALDAADQNSVRVGIFGGETFPVGHELRAHAAPAAWKYAV